MYLIDGLSANQIAQALGVSRTAVVEHLHSQNIRIRSGRMTNPNNYRHHTPPYGWKVKDGKLIPHKSKLTLCRRVVTLVRQGCSYNSVAKELEKLGFKSRKNKVRWDHSMVISIFNRWKEKL